MTENESTEGVRSEDTGLPVINEEGEELGVIEDVTDEDVTIDPAETLEDDTMAAFGWDDTDTLQTLPRSMLERTATDREAQSASSREEQSSSGSQPAAGDDVESYIKVFRFEPDARDSSETGRRQ